MYVLPVLAWLKARLGWAGEESGSQGNDLGAAALAQALLEQHAGKLPVTSLREILQELGHSAQGRRRQLVTRLAKHADLTAATVALGLCDQSIAPGALVQAVRGGRSPCAGG